MLISRLNDEVVLMQKNRKMMENTMSTSYKLFQEMEKEDVDPKFTKKALDIAKDVHELKKEYSLILRGLSEAMDLNTKEEGMYLQDIFRVLNHSMKKVETDNRELQLEFEYDENLYTEQHYFVLSVLRNLVNNAIEASDKEKVNISIRQKTEDDDYIFTVKDNGPGIEKEDFENIFLPGFSTKINFETGEVNRGLGLELVKDLVENRWKGQIYVESCPGETVFTIRIPRERWKEDI
jgi:two-component system sensor histidine kinase YcbA